MNDALNLFRYILTKFYDLIFNLLIIDDSGATLGWIIIAIIVFGIIINNILNIPNNVRFNKKYNGGPVKTQKGSNVNG